MSTPGGRGDPPHRRHDRAPTESGGTALGGSPLLVDPPGLDSWRRVDTEGAVIVVVVLLPFLVLVLLRIRHVVHRSPVAERCPRGGRYDPPHSCLFFTFCHAPVAAPPHARFRPRPSNVTQRTHLPSSGHAFTQIPFRLCNMLGALDRSLPGATDTGPAGRHPQAPTISPVGLRPRPSATRPAPPSVEPKADPCPLLPRTTPTTYREHPSDPRPGAAPTSRDCVPSPPC